MVRVNDVNIRLADPAPVVPSPRRRRLTAGALLLTSVFVLGWLTLRPAAVPSEAEGRAWLAGFADLLTSSRLLAAKGPAAIVLFPGLDPEAAPECVTTWSRRDPSAPIVVRQSVDLGRLPGDACDQAQFGNLSMTLRQSEGVTPGVLVQRFTEAFGQPVINRDTGLDGSIGYPRCRRVICWAPCGRARQRGPWARLPHPYAGAAIAATFRRLANGGTAPLESACTTRPGQRRGAPVSQRAA